MYSLSALSFPFWSKKRRERGTMRKELQESLGPWRSISGHIQLTWPQITHTKMLLVLFCLLAMAKGRFWYNGTREIVEERWHRSFLPCVHSEAGSCIFVDFGRRETINSIATEIKKEWGTRWEREHAHTKKFPLKHKTWWESPVPFSTQYRAYEVK